MRLLRSFSAFAVFLSGVAFVVLPATPAMADLSVVSVAAGGSHTCAIATGGGVKCWGWNIRGQVGDGTNTDRTAPVDVSGLGSGVAAIALGGRFSCALTTGGAVKCWGSGGAGQLGDGSTVDSNVPVDVSGLGSGVAGIAVGSAHSCALTTSGAVKCWGSNDYGQLGNGTINQSTVPVDVSGLGSGVAAISAAGYHTCAVTSGGAVKCWGYNANGQLGDGTTANRHAPVSVTGLGSGIAAVAAGFYHTCAVTTDADAECWGDNEYGQLGDGTTTNRRVPVEVSGLGSGFAALSAGVTHTCARTTSGAAMCWGRNQQGQLGDATTDDADAPVGVAGLGSDVVAVTSGGTHNCALTSDDSLRCWGSNGTGALGYGTASRELTPVDVSGLESGVAAITAGFQHTCALTTAGGAKCWGDNAEGELGDGTTIERDTPADVAGLDSGVAAIAAGYQHTCALTTAGAVKCWGSNTYGQLGDGTSTERHMPVGVSGLGSGVAAISTSSHHTCALTTGGAVKCWGYNSRGEVGDGTSTDRHTPVGVSGLASGITAVSAGADHTCALTTGGGAMCWGFNGFGALGDGTTDPRVGPVGVSGLGSGVAAIDSGAGHTCVVTTGGGVKCWGFGAPLGDGTTNPASAPVDVNGFTSGTHAVDAGNIDTCLITTGTGARCWGDNGQGQIGDGTLNFRFGPEVDVSGLGSGVASVAVGGAQVCAVTTGGGAKCWGFNAKGQLGIGPAGRSTVPVGVVGLGLGSATAAHAPSSVSGTAGDGIANIAWTPPADDGGSPVYGYTITATDANGGTPTGVTGPRVRTTVGDDTTFRFSGLSNGTAYRLDVAPLNNAGIGASALSSVVRPTSAHIPTTPSGYWLVGSTGSVYAFGHVGYYGNATTSTARHIEPTPTGRGYWIVDAAGIVSAHGDAQRLSGAGTLLAGEIVDSLSSTPSGHGYWLFTNRGRVMYRGDARFFGDLRAKALNGPVVASVATPSGDGYYMVGSDGGVFAFGDARFRGSMARAHLNRPVIGLVPTAANNGYWLVASDGGVFAFNAPFRGSMGGAKLSRPVVGALRYGNGYLMVASDGGVFDFSNLAFAGSLGGNPPPQPIVSAAATS